MWRCKHPHGLFSMFSLAMGHLAQSEQQGLALMVDWHALDPASCHRISVLRPLRLLAQSGFMILAPCAACQPRS